MQTFKKISGRFMALLMAAGALLTLSGCTHNNGDIGRWFGTWALMSIAVDGEPSADYHDNIVWKFQDSVFSMIMADTNSDTHSRNQCWGSWSEPDGNTLVLTFGYGDNEWEPGTGIYAPFPVTGLDAHGRSVLRIVSDRGNELTLAYEAADGSEYAYVIKKQ